MHDLDARILASDLGAALGDRTWADVKFIAGGRAIYAHRAVLAAASDFFRGMFRSGMFQGGGGGEAYLEVVVPDSHVGMLRLLLWIYTAHLEGAGELSVLIDDLVAADRFQLLDMKRMRGPSFCAASTKSCRGIP